MYRVLHTCIGTQATMQLYLKQLFNTSQMRRNSTSPVPPQQSEQSWKYA